MKNKLDEIDSKRKKDKKYFPPNRDIINITNTIGLTKSFEFESISILSRFLDWDTPYTIWQDEYIELFSDFDHDSDNYLST